MANNDKTILDGEKTVYDSDATVPDSIEPVSDDAATLDEATVYDDAGASSQAEKEDAIEKGRTLLNTYHVESDAIEGGMGKVWRVHHNGWNVNLAMKQPKAALFQTEKQKDYFISECESWINLGLHPHIVSCYYVRKVGGIPTIFSEWMDGGSLKNIIDDGSLYKGNAEEHILDIAIQFARGLNYAHTQGLIHQDVKPDNLLLTKSGEVKVADFGIAKARAELTILDTNMPTDKTMFSASGGCTPAYCSMEQMNGEKLTRRTDIYSWAVSIMEMFLGDRPWANGVIAGAACDSYFPDARVAIPEGVKALLKECLNADEAMRPHDFGLVEKRLMDIYKDTAGCEYGRTSPKAAADTADSLNNSALSFLDMGKPRRAEECWKKALTFAPYALEANYNYALYLWHTLRIDDAEARARIDQTVENNQEVSYARLLSAQVYMERGNQAQAIKQIALAGESDITAAEALRDKALNIPSITVSQSINAHEIEVTSLALSPDEKYLATGGGEKENQIKLWDAMSLLYLKKFTLDYESRNGKYHYSTFFEIIFLAVSKNARLILSYDNLLRLNLWETASGKCLKRLLDGGFDNVAAIGFSDDEKTIWAATINGTVRRWDAETFFCIETKENIASGEYVYPKHRGVFSTDGRLMLRKDKDDEKKICLWDIDNGGVLTGFELPAKIITFHVDAGYKRMAVSCDDGYARVCDLHSKQLICQIPIAENKKIYIAGDRLYAACRLSLKLYDINTGKCQRSFGYPGSFYLTVNTGGDRIYAENGSGIYVCSIPSLSYRAPWALSRIASFSVKSVYEEVFHAALLRAQKYFEKKDITSALSALKEAQAVPGYENAGQYLELNKSVGRYCRAIDVRGTWKRKQFDNDACSADFLINGHLLLGMASSGSSGQMREIDIENGIEDYKYGDSGRVIATRMRTDGKYFLAQTQTNTSRYFICRHIVGLYDAVTGEKLNTWNSEPNEGITAFAIDPAGHFAAIGTLFDKPAENNWGRIAIYELPYGKLLRRYAARGNISNMCFSHDGKRLFTSFFWWKEEDHEETECTETLTGKILYTRPFGRTMLFPDGQTAISAEGKTNMVLWKTDGSESIRRIGNYVYDPVAISPDCRFLLMESAWSTNHISLELWDAEKQALVRILKDGQPKSRSAAFSPSGQMLLFGPNEWKQLWDIDWEYEFPGWTGWDEGAKPYLEIFLALHPCWTEEDFADLINSLQNRGYGWLLPDGVRAKLQKMQSDMAII